MPRSPLEQVRQLYRERGDAAYFGEAITQSEHALQCAWFARQDGADNRLVLAALLHDLGHLIHQHGEDVAERGIDSQHEKIGAKWLARWLPSEITEPIRLHVDAKRYLCAREPDYLMELSAASRLSLELQGDTMGDEECLRFEREPHAAAALRLRRWDDRAKIVGLAVPDWAAYEDELAELRVAGSRS